MNDKSFPKILIVSLLLILCISCSTIQSNIKGGDLGPTVILVSIDGFRADYFDKYQPKNLLAMSKEGVRAKKMIPVFPSITFPSHYSLVTGLHPEHHGIISNSMWDESIGKWFRLSDAAVLDDPRWWGGEAIWETVQRQGKIAASVFWPGSTIKDSRRRPRYSRSYNKSYAYGNRVRDVLAYLDRPVTERPSFITLYFEAVDIAGHQHGPDSTEVAGAIRRVDRAMGWLISGLKSRKLWGKVNLVVVSDHGMVGVGPENKIKIPDDVFSEDAKLVLAGATLVGF